MRGGLTCDRLQSLTASCSVAHCSGTSAAFFRAHCQPQAPTRSAAAPPQRRWRQGSVSDLLELGVAGLPAARAELRVLRLVALGAHDADDPLVEDRVAGVPRGLQASSSAETHPGGSGRGGRSRTTS